MGRFFDPHIHMYSRTTDDYEKMSLAGIEVIVQPSFWLGSPRTSVGTFIDYWEHMISFETKRAKEYGIEHFTCISVNPKESMERPLAFDAFNAMMRNNFLKRERVVALGEIGYNQINDLEEEVFKKQLEICKSENLLAMIHLPHLNKSEGMRRMKKILEVEDFDFNKILIDHNTEETIKMTLEMGAWAGLSVYPITKLSPGRVINIVNEYGSERIMVNSAADWGKSDPLSVPLTAKEMRMNGCSTKDIKKVTFENAYEFYKQSENFTWRP
ncbi:MAG TPA: TatD family hydrolase [Nitrososphaeraceae archaeon]|nr:TatD family hydrolase [Nitrososphaeraceae archaeon]